MEKPDSLDSLLNWLYSQVNYERVPHLTPESFRLNTMFELVGRLGNPHLACPVIHVAGTKGKGSVTTMIGQILKATGRKTGVYISPHLETINQRIAVNGVPISDAELADALAKIRPIANLLGSSQGAATDGIRPPTFFEIITAAAFYYFALQQCDAVVLEVGMGGRLDSTNVCQPVLGVITSISFDHTLQLGNTLTKIAFEKAGIIKPGIPVISGTVAPEPSAVIAQVATERHAPLRVLGQDFQASPIVSTTAPTTPRDHNRFNFSSTDNPFAPAQLADIELNMFGIHQQHNAAIAIAACQELNRLGWQLTESHIRAGLASAVLPGRTEIVSQRPTVMLDIAHNPASIDALVQTLPQLSQWQSSRRKILILAISKDKDMPPMLNRILPHFERVIFTAFECNPRSRDPQELLDYARTMDPRPSRLIPEISETKYQIVPSSHQAWEHVCSIAKQDDFICITGSVFLVADLRRSIKQKTMTNHSDWADEVTDPLLS